MTDDSAWSPASWAILILVVVLILTVVVSGIWLYVRGRALDKATKLAEELQRSADKAEEKERLHAVPDLGPLLHRNRRTPDR